MDLSGFKLLPSAKPIEFHGSTVRDAVGKYLWGKKVRPAVLELHKNTCSICEWIPANDKLVRYLHLHEVEEYDFKNKVCHLIDIKLICNKCHAFEHILRTMDVLNNKQWEDLMQHFVRVNRCASDIIEHFDLLIYEELKNKNIQKRANTDGPVRFTVKENIPFAEEMMKKIEQKGLLFYSN